MNRTTFLQDAGQYHTIPLVRQFFLDTMTPIQLFQQLKREAVFLLESKDSQSSWSRYSFIGLNPYGSLCEENGRFLYRDRMSNIVLSEDDFQGAFQKTMDHLHVKPLQTPVPFYGGAVGCMGYDAVTLNESVSKPQNNDLGLKKASFLFCETILALDHTSHELKLFHHVRLAGSESEEEKNQAFDEATKKIETITDVMDGFQQNQNLFFSAEDQNDVDFKKVSSNYRKNQFIRDVEKIKAEIGEGNISQAVLSQRFEKDITVSGLDIYRVLRVINPSPYLFYLQIDGIEVVGSSPERLVQVKNQNVEIHPIAGTRKRGGSENEDAALARDLLADEKERAEHFMLVDLARHDVESVSKPGSVQTPVQAEIAHFSHVMHMISKVTGELAEGYRPIDAFLAAFPAGTVSGSPRDRAMEILQSLEPTARNFYAGAIGYFGFDGNLDACITIRTLIIKDQTAYIQAGAGIVAASNPLAEWEETHNKAKALIRAIEAAEEIFASAKGEEIHA